MPLPLPVPLPCPRLALVDTLALAAVIIDVIKRDATVNAITFAAAAPSSSHFPYALTAALVGTFEIQLPLHKFLIYLLEFSFFLGVSIPCVFSL